MHTSDKHKFCREKCQQWHIFTPIQEVVTLNPIYYTYIHTCTYIHMYRLKYVHIYLCIHAAKKWGGYKNKQKQVDQCFG